MELGELVEAGSSVLKQLTLTYADIEENFGIELVCRALERCKNIEEFSIDGQRRSPHPLRTDWMDKICKQIEKKQNLYRFEVKRIKIADEHVIHHIAQMLRISKSIRSLSLTDCSLKESWIFELSLSVATSSCIEELDLSGYTNDLQTSLKAIAGILQSTKTLRTLKLCCVRSIEKDDFIQFCEALQMNQTVVCLYLQNVCIPDSDIFSDCLEFNTTLKELYIGGLKTEYSSLVLILEALCSNDSIENLQLKCQDQIEMKDVERLSNLLTNASSLRELEFAYTNGYEYSCIPLIDEAISMNSSLTSLKLQFTNLQDIAVNLANFASHFSTSMLTALDLSHNELDQSFQITLFQNLALNSSLTDFNLNSCDLTKAGIEILFQSLNNNLTLNVLDVSRNNIDDEMIENHVGPSLRENVSLTKLVLSQNQISSQGCYHLAQALEHNSSLTCLELAQCRASADCFVAMFSRNECLRELNMQMSNEDLFTITPLLNRNHQISRQKVLVQIILRLKTLTPQFERNLVPIIAQFFE